MTDGHPLIWLSLLLVGSTIALNTTNPLLLLLLAAALIATGFLARGPRRASLVTALGAGFCATLVWVAITLVLPRGTATEALFILPSWSPGPGVTFGGPLDLTSVVTGIVGALRAVVVILLFGLAGQLVSARGWLALSRSTLGSGSPALHPLATLGEASVEALNARHRIAAQGWGRGASAGWLTSLLLAGEVIARNDRAATAPRPSVEALRVALLTVLAVAPVIALAFGILPPVIANNFFGTDIVAIVVVLALIVGLALPGTPGVLWEWRSTDLPQAVAVLLLSVAWALRRLLSQEEALFPAADAGLTLPWAVAGAIVLLPVAVGLAGQRAPTKVVAHA